MAGRLRQQHPASGRERASELAEELAGMAELVNHGERDGQIDLTGEVVDVQ